ncbi:sugar ABC transporter substrate-binding protein [Enemella evansiae]|uniref:ABC transporter substrate-binding protein n=1 Tax=Enemella evansiae TaxID=2016499 RepID=UPI000B96ACC4|nr:extracellular solute-binding protein [Enemella evansiae]OYO13730.1 sugar ABC transporter substrate-binding protein [Enemella evansiae]
MTKLRTTAVALMCAGALAMAGCTPGQQQSTQPQAANTDPRSGPQELTYLYFTDGPDEQATRDLIAKYEKEKGVKVNLEIVPFANLDQSLQARLTGDNAPDVARLATLTNVKTQLLDLNQFQKSELDGKFIPGVDKWTTGDNGERLAVPSDLTMNGPFVNTDMFRKAGVEPPTKDKPWKSWQEMVDAAKKVQAANNTENAVAMDVSGHRFSTMLSQYGTNLIGPDGKSVGLDDAKTTAMLTDFANWNNDGTMPKDLTLQAGSKYKAANEIFLAQQVPVYISGNWQVAAFAKNAKFGWQAVPNPCQERCGGFPGGKFMAAFKKSKNPALAAEFVTWMNSQENQKQMDAQANFLPTRTDLVDATIDYKVRSDDMQVFKDDISETPEDTYASAYSPAFTNAAKGFVSETANVLAGKEQPAGATQKLKEATEKAIKDVS